MPGFDKEIQRMAQRLLINVSVHVYGIMFQVYNVLFLLSVASRQVKQDVEAVLCSWLPFKCISGLL